jgi:hypothetical protein
MFKLLTITSIVSLLIACSGYLISAQSSIPPAPTTMQTTNGIQFKPIILQAREEQRLPIGQPPTADRDIGFADIFLHLENQQELDQSIVIEQVQIVDAKNGHVYMSTQAPQTIRLRPLEYVAQDIHLTNKVGFTGKAGVQAIVTYKITHDNIAEQTQTMISPVIQVDLF